MTTQELEQTQQAWEAIAEGYDEFVTPTHMSLGGEALVLAGIAPGLRFLDVAAGSGALSLPAARLGALVTATDITPAMIERLAERARREGLDVATRSWTVTRSSWTTTTSISPVRSTASCSFPICRARSAR